MLRRPLAVVLSILAWPLRVAEHRRVMAELGDMDDRGLADIGLARQDLRDATALPRGTDPSSFLSRRASEREAQQRRRRGPPSRMAAE